MKHVALSFFVVLSTVAFAQKKTKKAEVVTIHTSFGDMAAILHEQTPLHKANFLKLA